MIYDVEKRIVKLRNEIKAQKVSAGLTYSQLLMPSNTPQLNYTGTATWGGSSPAARLRFRFTRTDGSSDPPLVNFTHASSLSPSYKQFAASNGFSFSPNLDLSYIDDGGIEGYIGAVGDGYIDYYVDYTNLNINRIGTAQISTTCQVIANVYGTLSVERII